MEENWKEIKGYLGYEVSDLGRVRNRHGNILNLHPHTKQGNMQVKLYLTPHKRVTCQVKRLVAQAFIQEDIENYDVIKIDRKGPDVPSNIKLMKVR